jgi:hypothetical protein
MDDTNPFENYLKNWKNLFQDCNINFLIGSGLSNPFFGTLGNIEIWLSDLEENLDIKQNLKTFIKASLYGSYYKVAMRDNFDVFMAKDISDEIIEVPRTKAEKLTNTYIGYRIFL